MTTSQKRTQLSLGAVSVLSFIGAVISLIQTSHFYQVRGGTAGFKTFCNIGATFNCNAVEASPYAELFAGLPLSGFAAGWFVALLVITLIARSSSWRREGVRAALAMAAIGSVFSIVYLGIMAFVLKVYCLLCLFVDAINFVSLGLLWMACRSEGAGTMDRSKYKTFAGTTAVALFVGIIVAKGMDETQLSQATLNEMHDNVMAAAPVSVGDSDAFPSIGPKDAPVTIVKFSDYQCPSCKMGAQTLHPVLKQFEGKVRFIYRNYPLDMACNREVTRPMHAYACEAARGSVCANQQGKFEEYYMDVFEHQAELKAGRPLEVAKTLGLDEAKFKACMEDPATASAVGKDVDEGIQLGVKSTPTFFINGKRVSGALPPSVWSRLIREMLSPKK